MDRRPCGACGQLVTASGCRHWHPADSDIVVGEAVVAARAANTATKRAARAAAKEAKDAGLPPPPPRPAGRPKNAQKRMPDTPDRVRNRGYEDAARERARSDVAEFQRVMGVKT